MTHSDPTGSNAGDTTDIIVSVDIEPGTRSATARILGEIDMEDASEVRADLMAALEAGGVGLHVDLSALTFCDSSGLHLLIDLHHHAIRTGKTLTLEINSQLDRLLTLTQTRHLFTIHERPGYPSPQGGRPE
ncbi:STAS domain-containing protein [Streptomyces sp. NPDC001568]|uniref:STAS domain-containing protein n=1 Tax=Streptomyces sp. NPDC001568 TaxID=3364588 RepID=UPI00367F4859